MRKGETLLISRPKVLAASAVLAACFLACSVLISLHAGGSTVLFWQKRPLTSIDHENGYCFVAPLGSSWMSSHERPSPARLLENGTPLGPGNSLHDEIRKIGQGRFSFWRDYLYFSTSDNSDPRTTGRKYEVVWPLPVAPWAVWTVYLAAFLSALALFIQITLVAIRSAAAAQPPVRPCDSSGKTQPSPASLLARLRLALMPAETRILKSARAGLLPGPRMTSAVFWLTLLFMAASFLVWKHASGTAIFGWQKLPLNSFKHELGYCYQAPLGRAWMSSHASPSPARLFENGVPLSAGNSAHADIRTIGNGRYSFWHDYLYFSASDNSDPRTNGNKYEVLWPTPLNPWLQQGIYFITIVLTPFSAFLISRSSPQELRNRLFPGGKPGLVITALICVGTALILFSLVLLLRDPGQFLGISERFLVTALAYLSCSIFGFQTARLVLPPRKKIDMGFIRRMAALLGLTVFLAFNPAAGLHPSALQPVLIRLFLSGIIGFGVRAIILRKHLAIPVLPPLWTGIWHSHRLMLIITICVLIALPGIVKPLSSWWDISGYMDSHMYDYNAHDIATGAVPAGNGLVMPLYQYGMALLYKAFGHFFYVQQIVNVVMGALTIVLLCWTAWNLFGNYSAVALAGIIAACTPQLHPFVQITQIENWYFPLIALTLFAWSCYWRRPVAQHLVFLAFSTGLALNCRSQGIFFYGLLIIAPLFVAGLPWRRKAAHAIIAGLTVGAMLLPWTLRNYFQEGRFSPASTQTEVSLVLNDHRIPFYGLLENNWVKYLDEYKRLYPDSAERWKVMKSDFIRNSIGDPVWLVKAVYWRSIGYYSLLPPGVFAPNGPAATDWKVQWAAWLYTGLRSLFLIGIGVLALMAWPGRTTFFLALAIASNVVMVAAVPHSDPRYGYPVIPIHIILGLFAFVDPGGRLWTGARVAEEFCLFTRQRVRVLAAVMFGTAVFMSICFVGFGKANLYRVLREKAVVIDRQLAASPELPSLNTYYDWAQKRVGAPPVFRPGDRVRFRCRVTNYMLPPKSAGRIAYLPAFASDPERETYYHSYGIPGGYCGVTYFGAAANAEIRENDIVDVEGTVLFIDTENKVLPVWFWLKAEKLFAAGLPGR